MYSIKVIFHTQNKTKHPEGSLTQGSKMNQQPELLQTGLYKGQTLDG